MPNLTVRFHPVAVASRGAAVLLGILEVLGGLGASQAVILLLSRRLTLVRLFRWRLDAIALAPLLCHWLPPTTQQGEGYASRFQLFTSLAIEGTDSIADGDLACLIFSSNAAYESAIDSFRRFAS